MASKIEGFIRKCQSKGVCLVVGTELASLLIYSIPAIFLSRFLMGLTQGALWVPPGWRATLTSVGFLGGFICFTLARSNATDKYPEPTATFEEGSAAAALAEGESEERGRRRRAFAYGRAIRWLFLTLLLVVGFAVLKAACVIPWYPSAAVADNVFGDTSLSLLAGEVHAGEKARTGCASQGVDWGVSHERDSAYVTYEKGIYAGSILIPLGFPWSETAEKLLKLTHEFYGKDPSRSELQVTIDKNPVRLIDTISSEESIPLGLTRALFVLVHVLFLLSASMSFGYAYSPVEELVMTFNT